MLKKLHYKLAHLILEYGKATPKPNGHGSMVEFKMLNCWRFVLDDFSYGIHLYVPKVDSDNIFKGGEREIFLGMDFGGFGSNITEQAYKEIIGTIAKCFWRSRSPILCQNQK